MVTICTTSLTFTNPTFTPHSVFMCFVWISEQTAIISLYNINWLVCITDRESVYCAVRTGSSDIIQVILSLWRIKAAADTDVLLYPRNKIHFVCLWLVSIVAARKLLVKRLKTATIFNKQQVTYICWAQTGTSLSCCSKVRARVSQVPCLHKLISFSRAAVHLQIPKAIAGPRKSIHRKLQGRTQNISPPLLARILQIAEHLNTEYCENI